MYVPLKCVKRSAQRLKQKLTEAKNWLRNHQGKQLSPFSFLVRATEFSRALPDEAEALKLDISSGIAT